MYVSAVSCLTDSGCWGAKTSSEEVASREYTGLDGVYSRLPKVDALSCPKLIRPAGDTFVEIDEVEAE